MWPHEKATLSPGNSSFPSQQSSGEAPEKNNCNLKHCKRVQYVAISEVPPSLFFLGYYGFSWNCWTFIFEKQHWSAGRGRSQNHVRKPHPLHLLQLPVFAVSFAVLIQVTIRKSRLKIGKRPLALLAHGIKTWKLPSPHQKIFSLTGWFFYFKFWGFFSDFIMYLPLLVNFFQLFHSFSFLSL